MHKLSILSWNINSLLMRRVLLLNILKSYNFDIIMLQEVKISEINQHKINGIDQYKYMYYTLNATKGYAGVAIFSKYPLQVVYTYKSRVLVCYSPDFDIYFSTLYIYNGFSLTAPLHKKIKLYEELMLEYHKYKNIIIGGDFNICYDHECSNIINPYSIEEQKILKSLEEIYKPVLSNKKHITWWDYRNSSFIRNIGMGLDKFLVKMSQEYTATFDILTEYRKNLYTGIIPSDHAPIILNININN